MSDKNSPSGGKGAGVFKIYHNPRCSKSREALALLKEKGIDPEIIEYLKQNPTVKELKNLLMKLNLPAEALVRKGEKLFREKFKGKNFNEDEWVKILSEHPELIERPVVVKGNRAVIGRPVENIDALI
jgi:arsenate reductase (glutaredoxin)